MRMLRFAMPLALLGCARSAPPPAAYPEPPRAGPVVHLVQEGPSPPAIALYRVDSELVGTRYVPRAAVRDGKDADTSSRVEDVRDSLERFVCAAPCDVQAPGPSAQELFLGGDGITSSERFRLDPRLARVDIVATPGSLARHNAGLGLVATGVVSTFLGLATLPFGIMNKDAVLSATGGGFSGLAVLTLGIGIPLMLTAKTTYVLKPQGVALAF